MLGLKLNHVSKGVPGITEEPVINEDGEQTAGKWQTNNNQLSSVE